MKNLKNKFCYMPFSRLEYSSDLQKTAYLCCPSWLPHSIGKIASPQDDLFSVWNSPMAQAIRESIHDGSFRYCDGEICPHINAGTLPNKEEVLDPVLREFISARTTKLPNLPTELNLANDLSCNLSCPSCRTKKVLFRSGPEFERLNQMTAHVVESLLPTLRYLHVCGSGDPIGSPVYRKLLTSIDGSRYPNLRINLHTNAQLLTPKVWRDLEKIHGNLWRLDVSIDAATPETYRVLRRGGEFDRLMQNLHFLSDEIKKLPSVEKFQFDFVVQKLNFTEMPKFARLAKSLGAEAFFSKIVSWDTYSNEEFEKHAVWRPDHPDFEKLLEVLRDPSLREDHVMIGNLSDLQQLALRRLEVGDKQLGAS